MDKKALGKQWISGSIAWAVPHRTHDVGSGTGVYTHTYMDWRFILVAFDVEFVAAQVVKTLCYINVRMAYMRVLFIDK
jgi:hypothetical protein